MRGVQSMASEPERTNSASGLQEKPLLFVSHKHADKQIATAISEFIRSRTGGRIRVYQSSSFFAEGPRVGRTLGREIRTAVAQAAVVLLVYTTPDQDWNFCMWECGIASDPETPEAKIIVFQCGSEIPTLFTDQVHVKARDLLDIQKFTNELLTDPSFLPGYSIPLTELLPQSNDIQKAATDLFADLEPLLPDPNGDASWNAWPYIQFEVNSSIADQVKKLLQDSKREEANNLVGSHCAVLDQDKAAEQIFGVTELKDFSIHKLADLWQSIHPDITPSWVQSLIDQLTAAAGSRLPSLTWAVLPDRDKSRWYAPLLVNWRRRIGNRSFDFDVYFVPLNIEPVNSKIMIEVPNGL